MKMMLMMLELELELEWLQIGSPSACSYECGVCGCVCVWLLHMQITLRSDFTDFAAAAVQKT